MGDADRSGAKAAPSLALGPLQVRAEHERGALGRFAPGLPRISDGQLLFLLHMLAHAKEPKEGGSRIAIIMNGSPLFHRRRGQRRERDSALHPGKRPAGSFDRPSRAALLQHGDCHVRLGGDQSQGAGPQGQGAAHRRDIILGADAQESRRQAPGDPGREGTGDRGTSRQFQGWRDTANYEGRQGGRSCRQPDLPDDALRLPKDNRRAAVTPQLPSHARTYRAPRRGEWLSVVGAIKKEGRGGYKGAGRRSQITRGNSRATHRIAGHAI